MLKQFRLYFRGNLRNVVIVGNGVGAEELRKLFTLRKELGYKIIGKKIKNNIEEKLKFIKSHKEVDEIYCSIDEMTENQINQFVKYSSLNKTNIKFIPNSKDNFTKSLFTEYYNYTPVLSLREVALNNEVNQVIKRTFDIVFSFICNCMCAFMVGASFGNFNQNRI